MGKKRTIKCFTISDKIKMINSFKNGKTRNQLIKEFQIPRSTLGRILMNAEKIEEKATQVHGKTKRVRLPEHPELEYSLLDWIKQCKFVNGSLSRQVFKKKANDLAKNMNIEKFSASNGWLEGFKRRNNIIFKRVCDENSVEIGICNSDYLPAILNDYEPNNIFNADEIGLFFNCLPNETYCFRGYNCDAGNHSKDRVTLLLCSNMNGTEKFPLLLIGNYRKPSCLKNLKSYPVKYEYNKNSWITPTIFNDWIVTMDKQMKLQNRNVIIFIDDCAAHNDLPKLDNVRVIFLPTDTSNLQPLEQGVINNFKVFYRKSIVKHILTCMENGTSPQINLLQAMRFARKAWFDISSNTIANCFKLSGFNLNAIQESDTEEEMEHSEEEQPSIDLDIWTNVVGSAEEQNINAIFDYINVDSDLPVCGEQNDEEISDLEETDEEIPVITEKDARNAIDVLQTFFESREETTREVFDIINQLEKNIEKDSPTKQSNVKIFFH